MPGLSMTVLKRWADDGAGADRLRRGQAGIAGARRWHPVIGGGDALYLLALDQGIAQPSEPAGLERFQAGALEVFGEITLRVAGQEITSGIGDDDLCGRPYDAAVGPVEPPQLAGRGI